MGMGGGMRARSYAPPPDPVLSYYGVSNWNELEKKLGRPISAVERQSGVLAPQYEALRDAKSGELKSSFKYDPMQSEAFKQLREQALSTGPSAWAQMQTQKQGMEEQNQRDMAAKSNMQAMNQANAMLARSGGLSSGAAGLQARAGARNALMANQDVTRQGMADRLGISMADEQRRQDSLKGVGEAELSGQRLNLQTMLGDVQSQRDFDLSRYQQQMAAWGSDKTANAQMAASRRGKK